MGILVICSYRIKPGHQAEAERILAEHIPALRRYGLITDRPVVQGAGANGTVIEIFEWESAEKSRAAPTVPEIAALWKDLAAVAEFIPLSKLDEAQRPFAHFTPRG